MERLTLVRGAFALFAAALLILGIHAAALRGLADANYTSARLALEAGAGKPSPGALAAARAGIDEALRLEPSNPHFVEQSALLRERQALLLERSDPQARRLLGRSLEEFRAAALMRPGSPYVWASIAALKLRLDQLDFEFYGALERAARFGRWEPAVQLAIADIGLAGWSLLAQPAKLLALEAVDRALPRQGAELRRFAESHHVLPLVCAEAPGLRPGGTRLCVRN